MADLQQQQLDINTAISSDGMIASAYFEDYLFRIFSDINALNDEIEATGVTDGANVGGFAEVFQIKDGSKLNFRTIQSSDGSVTITQNADDLDLAAAQLTGTVANSILTFNLGTGEYTELPEFRVSWSGGVATISAEDDLGALQTIILADADAELDLFYDGSPVARTATAATGGLFANNLDTGAGFERVLTESDVPFTAWTTLYADAGALPVALALGTATHVLTSNGPAMAPSWQAAGGASLTQFQDNGLVGEALYSTFVALSTDVFGVSINGVDADTQPRINFLDTDGGTQIGNIRATSVGFVVDNRRTSAPLLLRAVDAAVQVVSLFDGDPDAEGQLFYDAFKAFETTAEGALITDPTGLEPRLDGETNTGILQWRLQYTAAGEFTLDNRIAGNIMRLRGRDTGGTLTVMAELDPDGSADLYFDGILKLATASDGIEVHSATGPNIQLMEASVLAGIWQIFTDGNMYQDNRTLLGDSIHRLSVTDPADQIVWRGNNAGSFDAYYNDNLVFETTSQGAQFTAITGVSGVLQISADVGQITAINFEEAANTLFQVAYVPGSAEGYIRLTDTGEDFRIFNLADGDMALFEGGAGATFYHDDEVMLFTNGSGISVKDSATGDDQPGILFVNDAEANMVVMRVLATGTVMDSFLLAIQQDSAPFNLTGQDSSSVTQAMIDADPDGALDFYFDGILEASTKSGGFLIDDELEIDGALNHDGSTAGFFANTPIIQQTTTSQTAATFTANTSGIVDDSATWNGYTIGDIVAILQAFGFIA